MINIRKMIIWKCHPGFAKSVSKSIAPEPVADVSLELLVALSSSSVFCVFWEVHSASFGTEELFNHCQIIKFSNKLMAIRLSPLPLAGKWKISISEDIDSLLIASQSHFILQIVACRLVVPRRSTKNSIALRWTVARGTKTKTLEMEGEKGIKQTYAATVNGKQVERLSPYTWCGAKLWLALFFRSRMPPHPSVTNLTQKTICTRQFKMPFCGKRNGKFD